MTDYDKTPYVETNALLALLEENEEAADRKVKGMLPGERKALAAAAEQLADLCNNRCVVCDEHMTMKGPKGYVATFVGGLGGERIVHHQTCPLPPRSKADR